MPHSSMRRDAARAPVLVVGAEEPADERLARDRDRVEREREERPDLERDLVGGDRDVGDARRDRGRERGARRAATRCAR